ncbi:multiple cyclophane-containing RiPP AmcA [Micromonospora fluostatini]|uniref:multiple cyclophane-containing RiPP AmcA n=1 Tax=Micromonospora sp. JCM 30529 TaxID=3421643 RepID=UPI003D164689
MTVYVSSHARTSQRVRPGSSPSSLSVPAAAADPPLFTYAWRRYFEQRSRQGVRR